MQNKNKYIIMMLVAAFLWSTSGAFIKMISWNSITIAGMRSLIAGITILIFTRQFSFKLTIKQLFAALTYAGSVIAIVVATKHTTAANAVLLTYTSPIYTAIGAHFFLHEKTNRKDWTSIIIIMVGLIFFAANGLATGHWFGDCIAALSGLLYAAMLLLMRSEKDNNPIVCVIWGCFIAFIATLPFIHVTDVSVKSITLILYLGIFQLGFSYILYISALKHITVLEANIITIIEPILNPVWTYFFANHEIPSLMSVIGGCIIVIGVLFKEIHFCRKKKTSTTFTENSDY